ncbi:MAG: type III-A CRISPR-associated RAMP protein Csm3 [Lachnospiraceae bacterium]|nr:type III-A CRISPR-associated RAMP protein Csm3 [Lachnospiraceae bacterium]
MGRLVLISLNIGGSSAFAAIGAVDAPIFKDIRTNLPMIPGSSLKGKMRTLLAKEYNQELATDPNDDCIRITRLFGSAKKTNGTVKRSRILVSDMLLSNVEELRRQGLSSLTEIKFENSINRATAVANPRQIERAVRGSEFDLDIMYDVENKEELIEDFETLAEGFKLLQYDYLGGNGSRGYGKVAFKDLIAEPVIGIIDDALIKNCNDILKAVQY